MDSKNKPIDPALRAHAALDPAALDRLLAHAPHVDDDGFSARVAAALPRPRRKLRGLILGGAYALAAVTALALPVTRDVLQAAVLTALNPGLESSAVGLLGLTMGAALATWAAIKA